MTSGASIGASALKTKLAIICGLAVVLIAWGQYVHSPSVDEPAHLAAGISHWELGQYHLYAVNPPFVRSIAAVPPILVGCSTDWYGYSTKVSDRSEFFIGRRFIAINGERTKLLFAVARFSLLPVAVLGAYLCGVWSEQLQCNKMAFAAGFIYCTSPDVLSNGAMMTPDLSASVIGLLAIMSIRTWCQSWSFRSVACCGTSIGFAVLAKFTMLPVCFTILVLTQLGLGWAATTKKSTWVARVIQFCGVVVITGLVIQWGYGWNGLWRPLEEFKFWSQPLCGGGELPGNILTATRFGSVPCPFPQLFVEGIDVQKYDFDRGFRSYLMGEWKRGGWWYYYLIGFLVKEPIGFQLMLYVSILTGLWSWKRWTKESIREWSLILVPPFLIFALVSSQTGFNHHMRYVLPAYPFLFIIAARTVTLGRFWKWFSYACLAWQAAAMLWFAPHWMSYFNEFAGGPKNGHKWLVDSNIDWGQDILMLKWWQDKHPEAAPLHGAVFTGFDPKDIGVKYKLPAPFVKGQRDIVSNSGLRGPQPGWFAISVNMLKGLHRDVPAGDGEWSRSTENFTYFMDNFEPVEMIGYSIYIYHISEDDAALVRAKLLAEEAEFLKAESGKQKAEGDGESRPVSNFSQVP